MATNTETLRHQNRAYVLAGLRELGRSAHTTLGEWSGLSSASVSAITAELEAEGVLERVEQVASSGRGRPRVLFGQSAGFAYLAMVRIATEMIEYSLVDYTGTLIDRFVEKRGPKEKPVTFKKNINKSLVRLAERSKVGVNAIRAISITTKGVVDPQSPTVLWTPVFDKHAIDFEEEISGFDDAIISVCNETTFSAQAVAQRLRRNNANLKEGHRIAVLSLGHSIGLGVATLKSHGRIEAFAPPFSHMVDQQQGPICRCGAQGCVEATAGFYGILRTAFGVPHGTLPARFVPLTEMDKLANSARSGSRDAEYAFRKASECLGLALARLDSLLNVSEITITGYGSRYLDLLLPGINERLEQTMQAMQGRSPTIKIELEETPLIDEGNMQWSLAKLDETRVATRLMTDVKAAG